MSNHPQPPKWILTCLEWFCDPYLVEGISGDLEEAFLDNIEEKSIRRSQLIYLLQAIGFFRLIFRKSDKRSSNMASIWTNYLLTSYRSLRKHRVFFVINLIGLITAISCSLFALIFINDELQFDKYVQSGDQLYRVYKRHINVPENVDVLTYETSGMMGPTMTKEYPEIEAFARVLPWWDQVIFTHERKNIVSPSVYIVDSTFMELFDVELIQGNPKDLLKRPSSLVISESLSQSLFGNASPIGKQVVGIGDLEYTVTGVFKAPPRQASMQFEALISWTTTVPNLGPMPQNWMNNWRAQAIFTFVRMVKNADAQLAEKKFEEMMQTHFAERAENYFLKLQPFQDMYLYGDEIAMARGMKTGSIRFVYLLGFSAFLIFLIASVNYVNIALSKASRSNKEVGIRKVVGSTRNQLMGRFIAETFIITLLASLISLALLYLILPEANNLIEKDIPLSAVFAPMSLVSLLLFILGISFLVGAYPAVVMSSHAISSILKSASGAANETGWLRKVLVTFQYAVSIFLIICTITVVRQINYLVNKPLGFNASQVMVVNLDNEVGPKSAVFRSNLEAHPNIQSVSIGRSALGGGSYTDRVNADGYEGDVSARMYGIDFDFIDTYEIPLAAGRAFRKGSKADSAGTLMVNQAFADFMGWEDPIGQHITFSSERSFPVIGVLNDFHIGSLAKNAIEPMVLFLNPRPEYASIRIGSGDVRQTIKYITDNYEALAERTPIDFYFVDQWFDEQYKSEQLLLSMASVYAVISVILCALGLYGLTALILQQRRKEISIRKILGATIQSIIGMMNRQFLVIILIGFVISAPLAYWLVSDWLDDFVYKIDLNPAPFFFAGLVTILVSVVIISALSFKFGNTKLTENLKDE
ncbi:MAG: FtsX-like permease family protein [Cytophagales bacterium]|nr:FtsX-like permease family protein [Cytophagales bacterium]